MSIPMYDATAPVLLRFLGNIGKWLDKAEAVAAEKKFDTAVLVRARLAPDMHDFARQIQIATDNAKGCVARLAGQVKRERFLGLIITIQINDVVRQGAILTGVFADLLFRADVLADELERRVLDDRPQRLAPREPGSAVNDANQRYCQILWTAA